MGAGSKADNTFVIQENMRFKEVESDAVGFQLDLQPVCHFIDSLHAHDALRGVWQWMPSMNDIIFAPSTGDTSW